MQTCTSTCTCLHNSEEERSTALGTECKQTDEVETSADAVKNITTNINKHELFTRVLSR